MRTVWRVANIVLLAACWWTLSACATAQEKKPFEIFRGGEGSRNGKPIDGRIPVGGVGKLDTTVKPDRASAPRRVRRNPDQQREYERRVETVRVISRGLADRSFNAYRRGLMPLEDHIEQLNLATRSNFQLAEDTKTRSLVALAHRQNLARIVNVLDETRKVVGFQAAPGFTADLALARAMEAQAEVDVASLRNDRDAAEAASSRAIDFARRHLEIRRIDVDLGFASLSMLTNAIMLTPEGFSQGRQVLADSVAQRREWARKNSEGGLGRIDHLAESELELARFSYFAALDAKDEKLANQYLEVAKRAANQMYSAKVRFNQSGTASVYQVARAWNLKREITQMSGDSTEESKEESGRDKAEFQRVIGLANGTTDQRGRNAADVSYVALLKVVNQY
jgi:hypothetical protein